MVIKKTLHLIQRRRVRGPTLIVQTLYTDKGFKPAFPALTRPNGRPYISDPRLRDALHPPLPRIGFQPVTYPLWRAKPGITLPPHCRIYMFNDSVFTSIFIDNPICQDFQPYLIKL